MARQKAKAAARDKAGERKSEQKSAQKSAQKSVQDGDGARKAAAKSRAAGAFSARESCAPGPQPRQTQDDAKQEHGAQSAAAKSAGEGAEPQRVIERKPGRVRRQEILQALALILGQADERNFSTRRIAAQAGISEACLYRHFKSKAEMIDGLVGFCREAFDAMFSEIDAKERISGVEKSLLKIEVLLLFSSSNPGITRMLTGEALTGLPEESFARVREVIHYAQTSVRNSLRLAVIANELPLATDIAMHAEAMMSYVEGRWRRFTASHFQDSPTNGWPVARAVFSHVGEPQSAQGKAAAAPA